MLITPDGTIMEQALTLGFKASNNEAEYEALLARLRLAAELRVRKLSVYCDSLLIANQLLGEYAAHHPVMAAYLVQAQSMTEEFYEFSI